MLTYLVDPPPVNAVERFSRSMEVDIKAKNRSATYSPNSCLVAFQPSVRPFVFILLFGAKGKMAGPSIARYLISLFAISFVTRSTTHQFAPFFVTGLIKVKRQRLSAKTSLSVSAYL